MKYLALIWFELWRKPVRTWFTLLSLAVGFLLFGLLQGVDSAFDAAIARQRLDRLLTDPRFGEPLPLGYRDRIARVPGVTDFVWTVFLPGFYQEPRNNVLVIATEPSQISVRSDSSRFPIDW
jgi:putative ABC transport system permease protein